MEGSTAKLVVGVMNDGDGDRFIGGGRQGVLGMNRFGPLVVRYLTQQHGVRGDVTRSLMTSHMADAAQQRYQPAGQLHETRVGFQFLKPYIATSVNSFEESDGMSPIGWSRDKDGILAALLLAAMVLETVQTVEELDAQLTAELGTFVFERRKIVGSKSGEALAAAISSHFGRLAPGQPVQVPGLARELCVDRLDTRDGIKVLFGHGWWFGVRASGTEPAARIYVETWAPPGASAKLRALAEAGKDHLHAWVQAEFDKAMA
jgi:phosphomannomutase